MNNYKGLFYGDDSKKQYFDYGAHFKYKDLVKKLEELKKIQEEQEQKEKKVKFQNVFLSPIKTGVTKPKIILRENPSETPVKLITVNTNEEKSKSKKKKRHHHKEKSNEKEGDSDEEGEGIGKKYQNIPLIVFDHNEEKLKHISKYLKSESGEEKNDKNEKNEKKRSMKKNKSNKDYDTILPKIENNYYLENIQRHRGSSEETDDRTNNRLFSIDTISNLNIAPRNSGKDNNVKTIVSYKDKDKKKSNDRYKDFNINSPIRLKNKSVIMPYLTKNNYNNNNIFTIKINENEENKNSGQNTLIHKSASRLNCHPKCSIDDIQPLTLFKSPNNYQTLNSELGGLSQTFEEKNNEKNKNKSRNKTKYILKLLTESANNATVQEEDNDIIENDDNNINKTKKRKKSQHHRHSKHKVYKLKAEEGVEES